MSILLLKWGGGVVVALQKLKTAGQVTYFMSILNLSSINIRVST